MACLSTVKEVCASLGHFLSSSVGLCHIYDKYVNNMYVNDVLYMI